jgi:radical SAM protein with 4Fe4S-binding SPASM domain
MVRGQDGSEEMVASFNHWRCGRDYQLIDGKDGSATLFIAGNHRLMRVSDDLAARLRLGIDHLSAEEAAEWDLLAETGFISEVNLERVSRSSFSDGSNLAINVNLTAVCNLGCSYCFAEGGDYGRIKGKLGADIEDDIFAFIADKMTPGQVVRFEFFGGEPLLNYPRIAAMCERAAALRDSLGIDFIFRISSNLTILPDGCLELFARHRFIVSVSIDGGRDTHDRNRPTKGGRGSWDKIVANCRAVRAASEDILLVARMTVVGSKLGLSSDVRELWALNIFDYFQIYPGVVPREVSHIFGETADGGTMARGFLAEFSDFVDEYPTLFTPENRFRGVLEYERIVDMVATGKAALSFCSGGRNYFTFSPDRSVMPCHRLVGETAAQVGESGQPLAQEERLAAWRLPIDQNPTCSQCWIRYICAGGCRQENQQATGDLNTPSAEGCHYQIRLVEKVVGMMAEQGREYREQDRVELDDMFVSCGRPMTVNMRRDPQLPELAHFDQI